MKLTIKDEIQNTVFKKSPGIQNSNTPKSHFYKKIFFLKFLCRIFLEFQRTIKHAFIKA